MQLQCPVTVWFISSVCRRTPSRIPTPLWDRSVLLHQLMSALFLHVSPQKLPRSVVFAISRHLVHGKELGLLFLFYQIWDDWKQYSNFHTRTKRGLISLYVLFTTMEIDIFQSTIHVLAKRVICSCNCKKNPLSHSFNECWVAAPVNSNLDQSHFEYMFSV